MRGVGGQGCPATVACEERDSTDRYYDATASSSSPLLTDSSRERSRDPHASRQTSRPTRMYANSRIKSPLRLLKLPLRHVNIATQRRLQRSCAYCTGKLTFCLREQELIDLHDAVESVHLVMRERRRRRQVELELVELLLQPRAYLPHSTDRRQHVHTQHAGERVNTPHIPHAAGHGGRGIR